MAAAFWLRRRESAFERGLVLLDRGETGAAVEVFLEGLAKKGLPPAEEESLRSELARAYLIKGAAENAREQFQILRDKFPLNAWGCLGLGFLNLTEDRDAFAAEYLEEAKKRAPGDARAYMVLADLHMEKGAFDKAQAEYLAVLNASPDDLKAREGLGWAYMEAGLFQVAAAAFGQVLEALPEDRTSRLGLVSSRLRLGEFKQAEQDLLPLLERDAADANALLLLADIRRAAGRREEAAALDEKLLQQDQRNVLAALHLAEFRAWQGRGEATRALLEQANSFLPKLEMGALSSFASLGELADLPRSRRAVRSLHVEQALAQARAALVQGLLPDAERAIDHALGLDPSHLEGLRLRMELARRRGALKERAQWAEQAGQLYPRHPHIFLDRAQAALDLGRRGDARTFAQAAITGCPSLAEALAVQAQVDLAVEDPDSARIVAEKAVALNPRSFEAQLTLGRALLALKRWPEAAAALQFAAAQDPFPGRPDPRLEAARKALLSRPRGRKSSKKRP